MNARTATNARYERPESQCHSDQAVAGKAPGDARKLRAGLWPAEVSHGAQGLQPAAFASLQRHDLPT